MRLLLLILCGLVIGVNMYLANANSLVGNQLPMPFGYGAAVVLSGSMEPEFSEGDLIFVKETESYKQNDIVVATPASVSGSHNQSVELGFEHIMSAVNVKIGTMPANGGTIQSMTFKNIYNTIVYIVANLWICKIKH